MKAYDAYPAWERETRVGPAHRPGRAIGLFKEWSRNALGGAGHFAEILECEGCRGVIVRGDYKAGEYRNGPHCTPFEAHISPSGEVFGRKVKELRGRGWTFWQ